MVDYRSPHLVLTTASGCHCECECERVCISLFLCEANGFWQMWHNHKSDVIWSQRRSKLLDLILPLYPIFAFSSPPDVPAVRLTSKPANVTSPPQPHR